jgi:hypothetical protein
VDIHIERHLIRPVERSRDPGRVQCGER